MIIKVGGGLEPLGPIGVYAYVRYSNEVESSDLRQCPYDH